MPPRVGTSKPKKVHQATQPKRNPFSLVIDHYSDFSAPLTYLRQPETFLPGIILSLLHITALLFSIVLWPYGQFFVIAEILWEQIVNSVSLYQSTSSISEKFALALTVVIYIAILLPIVIICLPGVIFAVFIALLAFALDHPKETVIVIGGIFLGIIGIIGLVALIQAIIEALMFLLTIALLIVLGVAWLKAMEEKQS